MGKIKSYGVFLLSLLIALVVLHFVLRVLKNAPVVGHLADKAEELAFDVE